MHAVYWGALGASAHLIKRMIPAWQKSPSPLNALASRSLEKAQQTAQFTKIPRYYGSYEDLLADKEITALYISLPNHLHKEWIIKAADAGKHILCEKPLCTRAEDSEEVIAHCHARGVLLMEAFMYRTHRQWTYTKSLCQQEEIGTLQALHCNFFYHNTDPQNIRNIAEYGGGALYDIGCYAVSSARWILGDLPQRVIALVTRHPDFATDVLSSGCLDYGSARAMFTVGTTTGPSQSVEIYGNGGHIRVEIPFNTYVDTPARIQITTAQGSRCVEFPPEDHYLKEIEAFSRSVREGIPLPISTDDAISNQRVLDALFRSEKSGNWEVPK